MIQHPDLDGPFSVPTAWTPQSIDGSTVQVPTAFADNRWNTTPRFFTASLGALTAYRVAPSPFTRVWAGDNPAAPTNTVALAFPDAATAQAVLLACGAIDTGAAS